MGELSLDGRVRSIHGVLPVAIAAKQQGRTQLIVPADNAAEAALVEGLIIYPVHSLEEAILALTRPDQAPCLTEAPAIEPVSPDLHLDYRDVKGQHTAKRALMVAAAGGHNLLMIGPPGSGKTMLARRLPSILPPMDFPSALEVSKIYSIMGQLAPKRGLMTERPFRSPHHSISSAGLAGGSSIPKPGEISLAHHGVLFLDELLEFRRDVLEVLRQPLEDRQVTIARAQQTVTYPASFMLVASLNPCPCGYRGDSLKGCICNPHQVDRYWSRLSGPMLDRMDIHLEVPRLKQDELLSTQTGEDSQSLRQRVVQARLMQQERYLKSGISANSEMRPAHLREFCKLTTDGKNLLKRAIHQLGLSARAYDRILKVARTVADLEGSDTLEPPHLAEAIQYRTLDRPMS